jgi:hypothetical protein
MSKRTPVINEVCRPFTSLADRAARLPATLPGVDEPSHIR